MKARVVRKYATTIDNRTPWQRLKDEKGLKAEACRGIVEAYAALHRSVDALLEAGSDYGADRVQRLLNMKRGLTDLFMEMRDGETIIDHLSADGRRPR